MLTSFAIFVNVGNIVESFTIIHQNPEIVDCQKARMLYVDGYIQIGIRSALARDVNECDVMNQGKASTFMGQNHRKPRSSHLDQMNVS
jgi:hypothetical protein